MSRNFRKLVRGQDARENDVILNWLTAADYAPQHSDFIGRHQKATGQWFLDSEEFQSWLRTSGSTLFCPGIPGAGKTIMVAMVIDYLQRKYQDDQATGIAYIYCSFRWKDEKSAQDLLSSLLKQLAQTGSMLHESVTRLYGHHQRSRTRPSIDEISKTHQSVAAAYSRVFIVIDALDECRDSARTSLLTELFDMQAKTGLKILATSREIHEIPIHFEKSLSLEVRATEGDVREYLDGHMFQLPGFVRDDPKLRDEVKTKIVNLVDGMCAAFASRTSGRSR